MIYILKSVEKLIFNGIDIEYEIIGENNTYDSYFIINSVYGRGIEGVENNLISVPGREGAYSAYTYRPPRYLDVSVTIKGTSFHDLRKKLERLSSILSTDGEDVPITFSDELDRIYYGKLDQVSGDYEKSHIYQAVISFVCTDPYKYSSTENNLLFPADIVAVENKGTAEALPIFELEATQKTTFAMVSNQDDEYNLVGQPADVDEQVIDERKGLINESGQTLSDWYVPSGNWSGSFATTGDAIVVDSWGTGDDWHGPALMKEIDPTEDFEIEMYVYTRTERPDQTFRVSTNFYDENMNELGMLRLWDKTTNQIRKVVETRVGPYVGKNINYLISHENYNLQGQRVWGGIIRVRREGNKYTFYAARVTQGGRHVSTTTQTFIDVNNEYAGRLKFIRFDIANFGNTRTPNEIRIEYIKVTKLSRLTVDQTPYILYPGDILEFDHVDKDIRLNGESRKDLKGSFGASFFTLKKGENRLVVTPENSFRTRVKFRERYL